MRRGGHGDFRSDSITARLARAYLREAQPEFLFLGLGETDEAGHQGNYEKYLQALNQSDRAVGELRRDLNAMRSDGVETLLIVTTDHGRSKNFRDHGRKHPESAQGFLFAEGSQVSARGRVAHSRAYLKDIAPTILSFMGLSSSQGEDCGRVLSELA